MYVSMHVCIACLCVYVSCCLVVQLAPSLQAFFMLFFSADLILRLQWRPFFYFHQRTFFKVRTYIPTYMNMYVRIYTYYQCYKPVYCSMLCILKFSICVCVCTYVCTYVVNKFLIHSCVCILCACLLRKMISTKINSIVPLTSISPIWLCRSTIISCIGNSDDSVQRIS